MIVKNGFGPGVLFAVVALACSSSPTPPPSVPAEPVAAAPIPSAPAPAPAAPAADTGEVEISRDILAACGMSEARAKFAYDSARVDQGEQPVLNDLAQCFTKGKLSGRSMRLVGHADPRGDAEYNFVLGGKRADSVKLYLTTRGVGEQQAETTSRGELEATGSDDAGWSQDRRVQVFLAE